MEPPVFSYRRVIGPVIVAVKRAIRKCIRWYVRPQTEALELETAWLRKEMARLEKELVRTRALALRQYREAFQRLEQLVARTQDARAA